MTRRITMTRLAQEYLAQRRKLGFQLRIEGQQLLLFARWADRIGHRGPLTIDLALRWARLPRKATPLYWARRLEVVRCFARHLAILARTAAGTGPSPQHSLYLHAAADRPVTLPGRGAVSPRWPAPADLQSPSWLTGLYRPAHRRGT
jgi:hypothetical protein